MLGMSVLSQTLVSFQAIGNHAGLEVVTTGNMVAVTLCAGDTVIHGKRLSSKVVLRFGSEQGRQSGSEQVVGSVFATMMHAMLSHVRVAGGL
ncbi:hypothetical protein NE237_000132 [Protea cynaroides]|uniref:Uncharacterized protein n=1 Tax=Protea cynaroides TaxID=273540 RepID=A0A9Q0JSU4_9MAGN|nr:hypothetical protein NE237_000132 [Protea cynaroides]